MDDLEGAAVHEDAADADGELVADAVANAEADTDAEASEDAAPDVVGRADADGIADALARADALALADGNGAIRHTGTQPPADAFHDVSPAHTTPGGAADRMHAADDELVASKPAAQDAPHGAAREQPSDVALYDVPGAHATPTAGPSSPIGTSGDGRADGLARAERRAVRVGGTYVAVRD